MLAGRGMGLAIYYFGRDRRYITETNIRLCFPELSAAEQQALVKETCINNGIGLTEMAAGWFRSHAYFSKLVTVKGLDLLQQACDRGKGVLLVGAHYTTLDLGAALFPRIAPLACTYRPNKNPLFDAFILKGRLRNSGAFDRSDIRGIFRYLRGSNILWYAPDQDYGPKHVVFAPFFGQQAATITATSRFARHNDSAVMVVRYHRLPGRSHKRYELEFSPVPDSFPSGDDVADATLINACLEAAIRHDPAQYIWLHKRFKTQPGGKAESPYILSATSVRRLKRSDIEQLSVLPLAADGSQEYLLPNGDHLKRFPGLAGKHFRKRHLAWRFDNLSKQLRVNEIDALVVGRIFRCRELDATFVSYTPPQGSSLSEALQQTDFDGWQMLGRLLGQMHAKGFRFVTFRPEQLYYGKTAIQLGNPHEVLHSNKRLTTEERFKRLEALRQHPRLSKHMKTDDFSSLYASYRETMPQADALRLDDKVQHLTLNS